MTIAAKLPLANLDDRIVQAFCDGAKSDEVESLIRDAEAAAIAVGDVASRAKTRALDPTQPAPQVAAARREMDEAAFRRDRLQVAVERLGDRLRVVRAEEENHRRQAAYDKAKLVRDKLAQELTEVYPQVAATLADLMSRIEASDRDLSLVNSRLPAGAERILTAELAARGLTSLFMGHLVEAAPSITADLRLPAFHFDQCTRYAWPRDHTRRGGG
jgi:hypothetical protein